MNVKQSLVAWLMVCGLSGVLTFRVAQRVRELGFVQRMLARSTSGTNPQNPGTDPPRVQPANDPGKVVAPLKLPVVPAVTPAVNILPAGTTVAPAPAQGQNAPALEGPVLANNSKVVPISALQPTHHQDEPVWHSTTPVAPPYAPSEIADVKASAEAIRSFFDSFNPPGAPRHKWLASLKRLDHHLANIEASPNSLRAAQREVAFLESERRRLRGE